MDVAKANGERARTRIALVLHGLYGGGTERVMLSLTGAFLAAGYDVDIVLRRLRGPLLPLVPDQARLFSLDCESLGAIPLAFARYLRAERPDAVIVNMWPVTSLCAIGHRLARAQGPLALVEHAPLTTERRYRNPLRRLVVHATLALGCRLADMNIAVSSGVADDIARLAGMRRDRFTVIHNPVEVPPAPRASAGTGGRDTGGRRRIVSVGRLSPEKNQLLLLDAFARVAGRVDAELVILGEGRLRGRLENRVAELGLEERVSLPGFVNDPYPVYRSADLFVLASDFEGFGNVIVEALACGVPVVSTDCPAGPREILRGGEFGALVPCGDAAALAEAMLDALAREHDPERLKRRAADFGLVQAVDAYLRILRDAGWRAEPRDATT